MRTTLTQLNETRFTYKTTRMSDIIIIMAQIPGPSSLDICIWISSHRLCYLQQTSTNCLDLNHDYCDNNNKIGNDMFISHSTICVTTTSLVYGLGTYTQIHLLHPFWLLSQHLHPTLLPNLPLLR